MNILIIGNSEFARTLGNKLKLSHHYNKHFFASPLTENKELEGLVTIDFEDESGIVNFCLVEKIDVLILTHQQLLENGFYDKLRLNKDLNRTIIVGTSLQTIQQLNNLTIKQKHNPSDLNTIEQIVVLTDGKNYKVLNEKDEHDLEKIEQQIIKKLKEKDVNISGFLCFNVFRKEENYELSSFQFLVNDEVATTIFERLETDVLSLFAAMDNGTLEDVNIEFYEK